MADACRIHEDPTGLLFKSRDAYIEWRSHWRREYKALSQRIHDLKLQARRPTNNAEAQRTAQGSAVDHGMIARCMMMARTAADREYQFFKEMS